MKTAGIDIGSRTVKVVVAENGNIVTSRKRENSFNPLSVCRELLDGLEYDSAVATGYGRHLFKENFDCSVISEIKAFALGARALFPSCQTILDIGGQDTKAISLDHSGRMQRFEMNDKCAAGTGRFLEIMAMALGLSMSEFGTSGLSAQRAEKINSTCTVFGESEVISLVARGALRSDVILGIHESISTRAVSMLHRVSIKPDMIFVGGVALNPCMRSVLESVLGTTLLVPDDPQIVGAFGCALSATYD